MRRIKLKFCGMRRYEDIKFAVENGVDFVGFIFFNGSKRYISPEELGKIVSMLEFKDTKRVGVFVNDDVKSIISIAKYIPLDMIQLHGDETNDVVKELKLNNFKVIKAFRVNDKEVIENVKGSDADFVLLDAFSKDAYGGTGQMIDECILLEILPLLEGKKIFLSGGINKNNIREVLGKFSKYIYAVDIASGIELSPGVKDHEAMKEIFLYLSGF